MKAAFASAVEVLGRPRSSRAPSESVASMKAGPVAPAAVAAVRAALSYSAVLVEVTVA